MDPAEITRRFTHHPPRTPKNIEQHEGVRQRLLDIAHALNDELPEGRSKSLCLTALEEAGFHAHAALARARAEEAPGS